MRYPLRLQIFVPFGLLSAFAVAFITATAAWFAVQAREREALSRLQDVVETLRATQFPFTSTVLKQMHGLSSAEFVIRDADHRVTASTLDNLPFELTAPLLPEEGFAGQLTTVPRLRLAEDDYFAADVPLEGGRTGETLLVLLPVRAWRQWRFDAALPPLAAGAAAMAAVLITAGWVARRLTKRLDAVRGQVERIADGRADALALDGPDDELRDFSKAVNSVSDQLRQHERTVRQTERMRLVAQLSSGLAHQLRNAASGARLAIQLTRRRHPDVANREMDVAMTQLEIIEDHLRRLLLVGPEGRHQPRTGSVGEVLRSVEDLTSPVCRHSKVALSFASRDAVAAQIPDFEGIRSGLLNLVMNGIEAAGPGGRVEVSAEQAGPTIKMIVADSGSGPDPAIADRIFEPFVTTKLEGCGLGLAFVRRMVESVGGTIDWNHDRTGTRFTIAVPATTSA
jgi:signal transduction histidine kinase